MNSSPVTGKTTGIAISPLSSSSFSLRARELELLSGKNGNPAAPKEDIPASRRDGGDAGESLDQDGDRAVRRRVVPQFCIPDGTWLGRVEYHRLVEALGGFGLAVERPEEIRPALEAAFASGRTACVNVMVDPAVISPGSVALANLGGYCAGK